MPATSHFPPAVSLPMYDWPEVRASNDEYYASLQKHLVQLDIDAPATLTRDVDVMDIWQSPNMLLSQTCGLPFVQHLKGKVSLIGAPGFDIGCAPGNYYSVIVVHKDSPVKTVADLHAYKFGYTSLCSQSGYAAMQSHLHNNGMAYISKTQLQATGGHRDSVVDVAEGRVDFAAVDIISWKLAQRYEPASAHLKVIFQTDPRPALPYITALKNQSIIPSITTAIQSAIADIDQKIRDDLLLTGFCPKTEKDYDIIQQEYQAIQDACDTASE